MLSSKYLSTWVCLGPGDCTNHQEEKSLWKTRLRGRSLGLSLPILRKNTLVGHTFITDKRVLLSSFWICFWGYQLTACDPASKHALFGHVSVAIKKKGGTSFNNWGKSYHTHTHTQTRTHFPQRSRLFTALLTVPVQPRPAHQDARLTTWTLFSTLSLSRSSLLTAFAQRAGFRARQLLYSNAWGTWLWKGA